MPFKARLQDGSPSVVYIMTGKQGKAGHGMVWQGMAGFGWVGLGKVSVSGLRRSNHIKSDTKNDQLSKYG